MSLYGIFSVTYGATTKLQEQIGMGPMHVLLHEPMTMEELEVTLVETYYKLYMSKNPSIFNVTKGKDKVESWSIKIKKAFHITVLSEGLKVRYDMYMLIEDVES